MIKKRAMAAGRQFGKTDISEMAKQWIDEINVKRLETGYADNQPKWPYWVRPRNYASKEWHEMGEWMGKTFGNGDWTTEHGRWVGSNYKYWFRDEQDRTFFILRWS
jgi:hypothetical protein